jgi:outer membrane protein OmpA-like peptidoglycan-associated protein
MKLNKILLTASILFGGLCASAQEEVTEYVFQPHWYGQAQFGAQETLGEGPFDILAGPNAQLAVGYNFNPYIGARIAVNSWRSRGTSLIENNRYKWHWTYIAPTVDAVFNVTNILGGFNPTRLVDVNLIAGIGANIAWDNGEANAVNNYLKQTLVGDNQQWAGYNPLQNIWDGTKTRFVGQFGFDVNFNVTDRLQVGLELMANVLNDGYNSKKAGNADWYFNGLVGVKYAFGPKYEKVTRVIDNTPVPCEPTIIEKEVVKYVEVPAPVEEKKQAEAIRRDVFFKISNTTISTQEMTKVAAIADYMNAHPDSKVTITGYADKGTGTRAINLRLSAQRAQAVANALRTKYGIASSRMIVKSMGEEEDQPYPDPVQNRVAICIAE